MEQDEFYSKLAEHEIGWWKAHHRRDKPALIEQMTKLYELQFGITYENAVEAVKHRVEATKEHDIAEKLEDGGNQIEADVHWKEAEDLLKEHFRILMGYVKRPEN
jgi:hypothetical protein